MADESVDRMEAIRRMRCHHPTLQELIAKKEYWGFLRGQDAVEFMDHVGSVGEKWTRIAQEELTAFMLGLPTKLGYRFEIIAGSPAPTLRHDVVPVIEKPTRTCLGCSRKFAPRRVNQEFHNDACHAKTTERYMAKGIVPSRWKTCAVCTGPFKPEVGTEKYCQRAACARASARKAAKASVLATA